MAADDLAFVAHRLARRSYLHDPFQRLCSGDEALAAVAAAATKSWRELRRGLATSQSRTPDGSNSYEPAAACSAGSPAREPAAMCHGVKTFGPSAVIATVNS